MRIAVYPGSFDPITNGHLDIIQRAAKQFDELYIVVADNKEKKYTFDKSERMEMLKQVTSSLGNIKIVSDDGLVADYAKKVGATCIIRGLRNQNDFQNELTMYSYNRTLDETIETLLLFASPEHLFLSSSAIKELVYFGADIKKYVPIELEEQIRETIKKRTK